MSDLVLEYKREGQLSAGRIFWTEPGLPDVVLQVFEAMPFSVMMTHLARAVQRDTSCGVVLLRSDREGLNPFRLDPDTVDLLRKDPVKAIKSMTLPPVMVQVRNKDPEPLPDRSPLRVGHDALAETFGDRVYCNLYRGRIECPACGRWASVTPSVAVCSDGDCHFSVQVELHPPRWATVAVAALIVSKHSRFYLPRDWNKEGLWATKAALQDLLDRWLQVKESTS